MAFPRLVALAALALLSAASAQSAGVALSVSAAALEYVAQQSIPLVERKIASINIPDQSWSKDGFEGTVTNIHCQGFTVGSAAVTLASPDSISASLANVGISCSASWNFKLKSWPHVPDGSGTADISVSGAAASLGITVTEASLKPVVTAGTASISTGSISISFHGSAWDWLLDLVKGLLESSIASACKGAFATAVEDFVNQDLNAVLQAISYELPLKVRPPYNISEVRFGLLGQPTVTSELMGVALQGDIVPKAAPSSPPVPAPALPAFGTDGSFYVQGFISSYTVLSAAWTYYTSGLMVWPLAPSKIPLGLNSTAAYGLIAPGFNTAYPSAPVGINISVASMPAVTIAPAGITVAVDADFAFQALSSSGEYEQGFTLAAATQLSMTIGTAPASDGSNGTVVTGELQYLGATLSLASSAVGNVDTSLLQALVDLLFNSVLLPVINAILQPGVPLPSIPGVTLVGTSVGLGQGFLSLASNFTFNPT